jgi:penicillin-insensitive murein endopeptidase
MGLLFFLLTQLALAQPPDGGTVPDAGGVASARGFDPRWSHVTTPRTGAPSSIGQPGAGCVQGAVALPLRGPGYVVAHPERHREYGHPSLIAYIHALVAVARKQKLGLVVVGDLGQPRGGPTPTGHRSHQNGLDVDIWYASPSPALSPGKEPLPPAPSVVDLHTSKMLPAWNKKVVRLVEAAAGNPAVDRIFVHPAVKRALCQDKGARGPWLGRLRPWWGHQDFVRRIAPTVCSPSHCQMATAARKSPGGSAKTRTPPPRSAALPARGRPPCPKSARP